MIKLGYKTFGLVVYGGMCPISRIQGRDAVAEAFSVNANKKAWAQVRAVPFTKKCLKNPKVRHDEEICSLEEYIALLGSRNSPRAVLQRGECENV